MRTKLFTRLLTLALVLMMTLSVPAMADECALCGKESGNDAYLCAACLLGLMEEKDISGGLEVTQAIVNEDGTLTIAWADSANNGPYTVYYELLEQAPVPFGWTAAKGLAMNAITLTQLGPGVSYVITIVDAAGNQVEYTYYAPHVEYGNEIGAQIGFKTLRCLEYRREWQWSADEIALDNGFTHGLYLRLHYSMLKKTRWYSFSVAVEAPNGFADVVLSGDLTLTYGRSELPAWGFVPMDSYFSYLERYYGGIPVGEYTVSMYFDGKYIHGGTFTVDK